MQKTESSSLVWLAVWAALAGLGQQLLPAQTLPDALDTPGWVWNSGGTYGSWYGQTNTTHDGVDAAQADLWQFYSSGEMWIECTVSGPGRLSFYSSAMLASYTASFNLTVDGQYYYLGGSTWQRSEIILGAGQQTLRWTLSSYYDPYGPPYANQAWLDEVAFVPPTVPEIIQQPQSLTRAQGATASFAAGVFGAEPLFYQWRLNTTNLANATNLTLTITNLQPADAGTYSLFVSNTLGTTLSSNATLTVLTAPVITQQPYGQTVNAGGTATFTVFASGAGPLWYQWRLGGNPIGSPTTNSSYTINGVQTNNAGLYSVVVSNAYGSTLSSNALLTVRTLPFISSPPYGQTVSEGYMATFDVYALGPGTLHYQWQFKGTNLAGATNSSLTLAGIRTNQSGPYAVVVSNSYGATTSASATLSVIPLAAVPELGEAVDAPQLDWRTSGEWLAQTNYSHDGADAAESTFFYSMGSGWIGTTVTGPGTLTFHWLVSTVYDPYYGSVCSAGFSLDGETVWGTLGTSGWEQHQFVLGPGEHALHWNFSRHGYGAFALTSAFLDEVAFVPGPPAPPTIVVNDGGFGLATNGFGFNLTGTSGQVVVVEGSTNLVNWLPLQTNTMDGGTWHFRDPGSSGMGHRFYRAHAP